MDRLCFVLFSATLALALGPSGAAVAEWVKMTPGDFGAESEFLDRFVFEEYEKGEIYSSPYSRERNIHVGRFDLNGDGVAELFVFNSHSSWCGSAGCSTHIFEVTGNGWRDIGGGPLVVNVANESVCGYRSLKGSDGIYRWNGAYYGIAYCYPEQVECRQIAVEYGNPERLNPDNGLIALEDCPKRGREER